MNVYIDWGRDRWVEHIGVTTQVIRVPSPERVVGIHLYRLNLFLETVSILDAATNNHPSLSVEVLMLKDPSQLSRLCKCPLFRPTQATLQKVEKMKAGVGFKEMR